MEAQRATATESDSDTPSRLAGFSAAPNIYNFMLHRGLHRVGMVRNKTKLEKWIVYMVISRGFDPLALSHQMIGNAHARNKAGCWMVDLVMGNAADRIAFNF